MAKTDQTLKDIKRVINETLLKSLSDKRQRYVEFFDKVKASIENDNNVLNIDFKKDDLEKQKKVLAKALTSKKQFLSLIEEFFPDLNSEPPLVEDRLTDFESNAEELISKYPTRQIEYQNKHRFSTIDGDPLWVRGGKRIKNILFRISKAPVLVINGVKKIRKKPVSKIKYWHHKIPERNLSQWYYKYEVAGALLPHCEDTDKALLEQLKIAFGSQDQQDRDIINSYLESAEIGSIERSDDSSNLDTDTTVPKVQQDETENEKVDQQEVSEALEERNPPEKKSLIKGVDELLDEITENYNITREKVGTFELSSFRFRDSRVARRGEQVRSRFSNSTNSWDNAHRIVLEDWKLNLDLFHAIYSNLILLVELKILLNKRLEGVNVCNEEILEYYKTIQKGITNVGTNRDELRKHIVQTRYSYKKEFKTQKIKKLADSSINQNFPALLDRLEASIKSVINSLPDKCSVIKETEVAGPVNDSDIFQISPAELIFFESFHTLEKNLKQGKLTLLKQSGESKISIEGLSNIVEFSLDSTLDILDDKEKEITEAVELIVDSIDRASSKAGDIYSQMDKMVNHIEDLCESALRDFNGDLYGLTRNENIYELRFRLTKAKAVAKTSAFKSKAYEKLVLGKDKASVEGLKLLKQALDWINKQRQKFSRKIKAGPISTNISNFLADSENKILKLPFVYQRLFSLEPVSDKDMFIGREKELKLLTEAFQKWEQGKYAATIVLSEKGGGITSLLNYFVGIQKRPYAVTRINSSKRIMNSSELFEMMGTLLGTKLSSEQDVIDKLNGFEKRRIVILEDLQRFFIRKVGGFDGLKALQRIISSTNNNIFWILNTTLYTWEYLHKSIKIGDVFEYQVNLSDMTVDQITEIISNRNKVSGYNIIFEIPEEDKADKSLKKLSEEEIQEIYRTKYFSNLNKFTKSNLSLSLLYWQLSVKEVTDDSIYIMSFEAPDLSFITSLDKIKTFVLQTSIIHDGLNPSELSEVLSISENESLLILLSLFEDGILIKREDIYIVNPLIYRQTVNLLKSHNLLN